MSSKELEEEADYVEKFSSRISKLATQIVLNSIEISDEILYFNDRWAAEPDRIVLANFQNDGVERIKNSLDDLLRSCDSISKRARLIRKRSEEMAVVEAVSEKLNAAREKRPLKF